MPCGTTSIRARASKPVSDEVHPGESASFGPFGRKSVTRNVKNNLQHFFTMRVSLSFCHTVLQISLNPIHQEIPYYEDQDHSAQYSAGNAGATGCGPNYQPRASHGRK